MKRARLLTLPLARRPQPGLSSRPIAAIVLLALVLVMALAPLSACGDETSVDPRTVLAQASAAMKKIKGFHFVYEVKKPASSKPSSGLEIARITGDVNSEGSMRATIDVTQAGIPLQLQFVVIGDTQYIQDPLSQKWQSIASADSPVGELSLSAGTIRILEQITDTSYEGRESRQGTDVHHITGKVAAEEVKAIAGAVSTTGDFPTDVWVGVENSLVYEVQIAGAATASEDPDTVRTIVLSNLDVYIDIEAPI